MYQFAVGGYHFFDSLRTVLDDAMWFFLGAKPVFKFLYQHSLKILMVLMVICILTIFLDTASLLSEPRFRFYTWSQLSSIAEETYSNITGEMQRHLGQEE